MLYIKMDPRGHYENDKWFDTPIIPFLSGKTLDNGSHDYSVALIHGTETFVLTPPNDTIWILTQDQVMSWTNSHNGHYGHSKGDVIAHRLRDTDIVLYEMPEGSWFVSDNTVYHNDGGVLLKFSTDTVIGWETWDSIPHCFYASDAIEMHQKKA